MNRLNLSATGFTVAALLFLFPSLIGAHSARINTATQKEETTHLIWSEVLFGRKAIFYSRSINGGWAPKIQLSSTETNSVYPSIGSGANGQVWAVWVSAHSTGTDLHFTVNENIRWAFPVKVETGFPENTAPSMVVDDQDVPWIVWSGNAGGDDDIYFTRWNGGTWNPPVQINEDNATPDILPFIGMGEDGLPWVAWLGWRDGKYVRFYRKWNGSQFESVQSVEQDSVYEATICASVSDRVEISKTSSVSNDSEGLIIDGRNNSRFHLRNRAKRNSFCRWSDTE